MKFEKYYQEKIIPELRDLYVPYGILKGVLAKVKASLEAQGLAMVPRPAGDLIHHGVCNGEVEPPVLVAFWHILHESLEKVVAWAGTQFTSFVAALERARDVRARLASSNTSPRPATRAFDTVSHVSLPTSWVALHQELIREDWLLGVFLDFMIDNFSAARKIVKKHDRVLGLRTLPTLLSSVRPVMDLRRLIEEARVLRDLFDVECREFPAVARAVLDDNGGPWGGTGEKLVVWADTGKSVDGAEERPTTPPARHHRPRPAKRFFRPREREARKTSGPATDPPEAVPESGQFRL